MNTLPSQPHPESAGYYAGLEVLRCAEVYGSVHIDVDMPTRLIDIGSRVVRGGVMTRHSIPDDLSPESDVLRINYMHKGLSILALDGMRGWYQRLRLGVASSKNERLWAGLVSRSANKAAVNHLGKTTGMW